MSMTVHQHRAARQGAQSANQPTAIDQGRADALRKRFRRPGIFDEMVMESNEPAGSRVLRRGDFDSPLTLATTSSRLSSTTSFCDRRLSFGAARCAFLIAVRTAPRISCANGSRSGDLPSETIGQN